MTKQQTTEIESLRTFALAHNEIKFAHLCTAALNGEEWAMTRMLDVIDMCDGFSSAGVLNVIRATDTMRPDGAVARSFTL